MRTEFKEWSLIQQQPELFILQVSDPIEGEEKIYVTKEQLESLRVFLNDNAL
jgi:hypothetical protein